MNATSPEQYIAALDEPRRGEIHALRALLVDAGRYSPAAP